MYHIIINKSFKAMGFLVKLIVRRPRFFLQAAPTIPHHAGAIREKEDSTTARSKHPRMKTTPKYHIKRWYNINNAFCTFEINRFQ